MDAVVYDSLIECSLFRGLSRDEIAGLVHQKNCRLRTHHRGSLVAFRGDLYTELWIVVEGRLRAEFQDHRGKVLKVESLKKHEPVATSVLFAPSNYLPVNLIAEEETKICSVPKEEVLRMLQADSRLLVNYLEDTGLRLSILAEKLNMLQFSTIREKIAGYLLDEADKQGTDSPGMPLSREALSEVFGVTRPALSREFSRFCGVGTLSLEGHVVHIMKRDELVKILEEP